MPPVKIKPGLSHRNSDGEPLKAGDVFDASPAEMESFGDKFELVEDDRWDVTEMVMEEPEPEPPELSFHFSATRGAIALATEHGISLPLSGIIGSGQSGRITKTDVAAFLNNEAEAAPNGDAQ